MDTRQLVRRVKGLQSSLRDLTLLAEVEAQVHRRRGEYEKAEPIDDAVSDLRNAMAYLNDAVSRLEGQ